MSFSLKKTLKHTYQQRDAIIGYFEVLNMKLNIWCDNPSNYKEDFCVFDFDFWIFVSVDVGIFSEKYLASIFPFGFFHFSSYG